MNHLESVAGVLCLAGLLVMIAAIIYYGAFA